ncbi:TPA: DUF2586 domain-containing protein [Serratia fonticola]
MTWPNVTINQLNRQQGRINEIERTLLFIGVAKAGTATPGDMVVLNSQSDIDSELELAGTDLLENVRAAQLNGGQNWQAYAIVMAEDAKPADWIDAIRAAQALVSVEGVVVLRGLVTASGASEIALYAALRQELINKFGRWVWFIITAAGPNVGTPVTWAKYLTNVSTITTGAAAYAVQIVPALWGNEAGVLAGRLCDRSVTVADSPARVMTGPLLGLGIDNVDLPVDVDGVEVSLAHLQALHDLRCSVPMWYPDYEGMYWSDGRTLDVNGGDYQTVENLRIVDKVSRRVRLMAIPKIADRAMNSTPASVAAHRVYFAKPMRELSRNSQINGITFPGETKPPKEGDVIIVWSDSETVSIYVVVRPYGSAKSITVGIMLDQTLEG